jgi:hypothetical protein
MRKPEGISATSSTSIDSISDRSNRVRLQSLPRALEAAIVAYAQSGRNWMQIAIDRARACTSVLAPSHACMGAGCTVGTRFFHRRASAGTFVQPVRFPARAQPQPPRVDPPVRSSRSTLSWNEEHIIDGTTAVAFQDAAAAEAGMKRGLDNHHRDEALSVESSSSPEATKLLKPTSIASSIESTQHCMLTLSRTI